MVPLCSIIGGSSTLLLIIHLNKHTLSPCFGLTQEELNTNIAMSKVLDLTVSVNVRQFKVHKEIVHKMLNCLNVTFRKHYLNRAR